MADTLPIAVLRLELIDQGFDFGTIQTDINPTDGHCRFHTSWAGTYLSSDLSTPHIIRVGTPSGRTKEFDLLEPDSIERILETITCTKVVT